MTAGSLWHVFGTAALLVWAGTAAQAQTMYRIVGADGKITFSDKPPASTDQGKVVSSGVGASSAVANTSLPFELHKVASKFPVTLYTGSKCSPCDAARSHLVARGVPFTERTITTPEDTDSLQRIAGEPSLPFITVGGQRIGGFADTELRQALDAAGYPKTSALPRGYQNPASTPLVAVQKLAVPGKAEPKPAAIAPPVTTAPSKNPGNPAGIIF